jgi:hypothetical protein
VGYGGVFVAGKEGRSLTQLDAVFRDGLFGEVSVFLCCRRLEVLVLALEKVAVVLLAMMNYLRLIKL